MKPKLSKSLAGFRKKHIIQRALLKMVGTWDYMLNKGNKVGEIAKEFTKAIWHAKPQPYGFNKA